MTAVVERWDLRKVLRRRREQVVLRKGGEFRVRVAMRFWGSEGRSRDDALIFFRISGFGACWVEPQKKILGRWALVSCYVFEGPWAFYIMGSLRDNPFF